MTSFVRRHIDVDFELNDGLTFEGGNNAVRVSGMRVSAQIQKAGALALSQLSLRIYGLPLDTGVSMNKLSTLGKPLPAVRNNVVSVYAYNEGDQPALIFRGIIQYAWADMNAQPDVVFNVQAYTGLFDSVNPVPPTSFPQGFSAATAMEAFAGAMGLDFENNGVTTQLPASYFDGTVVRQARACAAAAQINMLIDDTALAIWPNGGNRAGPNVEVSSATGMINYPAWTQNGVSVRTLLNPSVKCGGTANITSDITPANGPWYVYSISHVAESEMPGGNWFTQMECSVIGRPVPIA